MGNKKAKKKWNPKRIPFPYDGEDDPSVVEEYIRDKYVYGRFRDDPIDPDDYEYNESQSRLDSYLGGRSRLNSARSRSRLNSMLDRPSTYSVKGDLPRLTHRKLTTYEYSQYQPQVRKITSFGYTNHDSILESLLLSGGNIELALDILEYDSKVNPNENETAPQLPKRKAKQPEEPKSAGDWWGGSGQITGQPQMTGQPQSTGQPQMTGQPQSTGQPQIYQYTDPVTGQISYIDENGQQYLDPNNPQHQQQLMQQTNPQYLQQQATKQSILSLYGQQNAYMTNVVVPTQQQATQQNGMTMQQGTGMPMQTQPLQQPYGQPGVMAQATSNGFGPQASGFQPQFQPNGYVQQNQFTGFGQQQWR
jgi:hypothetical protein